MRQPELGVGGDFCLESLPSGLEWILTLSECDKSEEEASKRWDDEGSACEWWLQGLLFPIVSVLKIFKKNFFPIPRTSTFLFLSLLFGIYFNIFK